MKENENLPLSLPQFWGGGCCSGGDKWPHKAMGCAGTSLVLCGGIQDKLHFLKPFQSSLWAIPAKAIPSPLALSQKLLPSLSLEALKNYFSVYTTSPHVIANQGLFKYSSPSAEPKPAGNNTQRVKFMWGKNNTQ